MQTLAGTNNWVNIELKARARVKSILIVNREANPAYLWINPSDIRVGNNPDVSKNPSCGVTVVAAGVFKCGNDGLVG